MTLRRRIGALERHLRPANGSEVPELTDEERSRRLLAVMTDEELEALAALYDQDGQLLSFAEADALMTRVFERLKGERWAT